jgi:hypothetical protein
MSTNFCESPQYQISRKSVQHWYSYMRTDRLANETIVAKLTQIATFHCGFAKNDRLPFCN